MGFQSQSSFGLGQPPAAPYREETLALSIAKEMFLTKGTGKHREKLTSLEMSLRDAGIAAFNIVRVSSIFPPHCKLISQSKGLKKLQQGQIVFAVMSEAATDEANRLVAAAVGVAMPKDPSLHGYLSEHHSHGQTEKVAGDYSEDLAAEMLATTEWIDRNVAAFSHLTEPARQQLEERMRDSAAGPGCGGVCRQGDAV